jgi:hypothetical protein
MPCLGERFVVFTDGFEVLGIRGAAGDLDAQVGFDVVEVLREVQEGVVVLQPLRIIAEVGIGQVRGSET